MDAKLSESKKKPLAEEQSPGSLPKIRNESELSTAVALGNSGAKATVGREHRSKRIPPGSAVLPHLTR